MRLQKYLASCGVASRRAAEKLIAEGHVTVDGQKITEMGVQVEDDQVICVDGKRVRPEVEKHYIIYHKPAGEVTTVSDPEGRATVLDRFRDYPVRLYPVGRLDYDSEDAQAHRRRASPRRGSRDRSCLQRGKRRPSGQRNSGLSDALPHARSPVQADPRLCGQRPRGATVNNVFIPGSP